MSRKLNDTATIGAYIDGVIARLDHHGITLGIADLASFKALVLTTMAKVFARADHDSVGGQRIRRAVSERRMG